MLGAMLTDAYARKFSYLRLSITEKCNFSCKYCLPEGYKPSAHAPEPELSLSEIRNLLAGISHAGFRKIRITGGEPTLRPDLLQIIEAASETPGIEIRALSTNGWNLRSISKKLKLAGLTHLNVSVDSLDRQRFLKLCGRDSLHLVLAGIEEALALQFAGVKINAVLHRDSAQSELEHFLEYVKSRPLTVRFIELMRTGERGEYRDRHFLSAGGLKLHLLARGWKPLERELSSGPAHEFYHPDFSGRIGLIAPHSDGFCESCNRLRVTSQGKLKLCLFGEKDESIRPFLQSKEVALGLDLRIQQLLVQKPGAHFLSEGRTGGARNFSVMGG
ncbi:MAG: GTP 3',8-cyclase MoaA [Bdellovibrionales bacterium]|nr:GTP 3',8-cyclase MoaA [Bdellovibrionales bacterium]